MPVYGPEGRLHVIRGSDQIIACPKCKGLAKHLTLSSGNDMGARVWSDGKRVAPMSPHPPYVVKCRHCGECYWLAEAEQVGTVGPWSGKKRKVDPAWTAALEVEEPTEEEYYLAIEKGLATDSEQERVLRVLAWWRRNDAFCDPSPAPAGGAANLSTDCSRNLEALLSLLNHADDSKRILKAEVRRELGEFESARQVLNGVTSSDYGNLVGQLLSMCESKDTCVREFRLGDQ